MVAENGLQPQVEDRPIDWLLMPFQAFLKTEASGGILLLACAAFALVWANSPWSQTYHDFWHTYVTIGFGQYALKESLAHWVNDGLMVIFFFVVGLEIKREVLVGELASPRKAAVPIAAAVGGMAAPALVYILLNLGRPTLSGWAIPAATDIAFALGVMALLGPRVPTSLKIFLTALAIVDDIGAVLIIAVFYTSDISTTALIVAGAILVLLIAANLAGIRRPLVYGLLGVALWLAFLESGVHATVAGVILAFTIPSRCRIKGAAFVSFARRALDAFERGGGNEDDIVTNPARQSAVHALEVACEHVETPLTRMEHALHPWVSYAIMPVFALANAGVSLGEGIGQALTSSVGLGVMLGLIIGKQVGVTALTWLSIKANIGQRPAETTWPQIYSTSWLSGIGFTMSLFIANLAFPEQPEMLESAKIGILAGSLVAGVAGFVMLRSSTAAQP
ncbi:MAG: Na+/H+ antiporter NhaA [Phycisphaerae bacterium]|nr:Na+/H+ antiporter NhaA [Phycisphaerae bacterium]